jgi:ectoine hydroxylase-related dioxygenase (phytanoyl-CoA dioxygenase family)
MPVDPVPRESTLEFLAGSHCGPWLMPRSFMDDQAKWFPEGTLEELPAIDRATAPVLGWALEPGDAVFFHMLTLHAAAGSRTRRRAFSVRFLGDDVRHAPRAWTTSPPFPGLEQELAAGAPMAHPLFPIVWEASPAAGAPA